MGSAAPLLPRSLPLCPLFLVATTKLSIVIILDNLLLHRRLGPLLRRRCAILDIDVVTRILRRKLVFPNHILQLRIRRVDELDGRDAALVLDARVRPGLEHHLDQGFAEGPLGGGFRVEPADDGVQGRVSF